ALAKMLLHPVNFLILDEPTNHLDIPAKEMLEEALKEYEGTVTIVSHDRYFISQVANKIVEVRDGELRMYAGDYAYYLEKLDEEKREAEHAAAMAAKAAKEAAKRAKEKEKQKEKAKR
ncbi:MAG: ABC-F family ATP-binding cassette domain-containing protein, partial [Pseudanabaena sp. RU_4_16]|nr:ABC-F family ATP-binding cassette domain-containing protein [Pseudanabaena sp. RU_4_16]